MTVKAEVIEDSIGSHGARIITFQIYAPRFLLAEINTHGVIAKSTASSRAIPVKKRIEMVREDPYIPMEWGKNKPGMQHDALLETAAQDAAETEWRNATDAAVFRASKLADLELHKQYANRVLEPFAHCLTVLTATEWTNFFNLRMGKAAQPEFQRLAEQMWLAREASKPVDRWYHLPYASSLLGLYSIKQLFEISAARCARVSYNTFDGKPSTPEADVELCEKLVKDGHMSPFDHAAYRDSEHASTDGYIYWSEPEKHGRFWGWKSNRLFVEQGLGHKSRRDSFAPLGRVDE